MKTILLHGDNIAKAYERLKKFIDTANSRDWEALYDETNLTLSLFGKERLLVIRDYKILTKKTLESFKKIDGTLVIYSETTIPAGFIKNLPKETKIEEFKLPKLIWNFLEHIYPKNSEKVIKEFHQVLETEPVEFIFSLISKLFRDLYWVRLDAKSLPYAAWRVGKLKSQASKFEIEKLKEIINKLSDLDVEIKTGKANLVSSLDLFVLKHLE